MNKTGKGGFKENPQNIGTKPKGVQQIPDMLRRIGKEDWLDKDTGKIVGEKLELILQRVYVEALSGSSWAVHFIADRTEGKAIERRADVTDKPIQVFDRWNGERTISETES